MPSALTARQIKEWAAELGLYPFGMVRPQLADAAASHHQWTEAGRHGEMHYLARRLEERADPSRLLPDLSWVLVAGHRYIPEGLTSEQIQARIDDADSGYIAQYARGRNDYHDVLKTKLEALMARIQTLAPQVRWKSYVDTGPVLEKALAAQAGVGWQGKHTNLLHPQAGNWFFLGEVLTNLELPDEAASTPLPDRCGSCTACLDSCPTDAFPAPYELDARRCVSYLTIELKGPIPTDLRAGIGTRVFGCDDCLAACPYPVSGSSGTTAAPPPEEPPSYTARPITDGAHLLELMALTREDFTRLFKRTALFRTKRRGLLRNVAVALGNRGNTDAVPVLTAALTEEEPLIRGHAAWALHQIGGEAARLALTQAAQTESDPWVLDELHGAG